MGTTIRSDNRRFIYHSSAETAQLYDLEKDPLQLDNMIERNPEEAARFFDIYKDWLTNVAGIKLEPRDKSLSGTEEANLRALGYID